MNRFIAMNFAMKSETDDLDPVLLQIHLKNESGKMYFSLDSSKYSQYQDEQEILLQSGLSFQV